MRRTGLSTTTFGSRSWGLRVGMTLLVLGASFALWLPFEGLAYARAVEVRNLGLSRLGGRTILTIILDQAANPQVLPFSGKDRSQLVVNFPQARAGKLPETLAGDEALVKQLRTEVSGGGVKIILEMYPEQPYTLTREIRPLPGNLAMFRLGLTPDPGAAQVKRPPGAAMPAPQEPIVSRTPEPAPLPPEPSYRSPGGPVREEAPPMTAPPSEPAVPPVAGVEPTGTFSELSNLIPQARGLLDFLRAEGWSVAKSQSYDRPGQRFSRSFNLTNARYPELKVRIAHVPPNTPGTPYINIIDLTMDNLSGQVPDEYRNLRQWNFAKIKTKYEDIGDFFDEALKPLRVKIRQQCQDMAIRHAQFITNFLRQAVPQNPKLADEALTLIRKKVNPRFEGVQFTLSENPLVILNLVDFLYLRIYYLSR